MRLFNRGKPFHGSKKVEGGRLRGGTDTDYFYFLCPVCRDSTMLRILDYTVVSDGPVEYAPELRRDANRDFILAFELKCKTCNHHDFVKIGNIGWQGGRLSDVLGSRGFSWPDHPPEPE